MHFLGAAYIYPEDSQPSMTQQKLRLNEEMMLLCSCYTSPITRARRFAELAWGSREAPLLELPTLKEAHLGWLQGMRQGNACLQLSHTLDPLSASCRVVLGLLAAVSNNFSTAASERGWLPAG